jgi:DNA-binding transcriptional LysR family regulator
MLISPLDVSAFLEVVRKGSISRAAEALGVTQPSVSKAIRRLEEATGVTLLVRGFHGVTLTSEGQVFHESAARFDLQRFELQRLAGDLRARQAGLLRLGLTSASSESAAVQVVSDLVRRRPGMRLRLIIGKSDALDAQVEEGALDMALVPTYPGVAVRSHPLQLPGDRMQVVVRSGHPLLSERAVSLPSLVPYFWVMAPQQSAARKHLSGVFEAAQLPSPQVAVEAEYTSDAVMGIVSQTNLLALAPSGVLRSWLGRVFPLPIPMLELQRSLVLLTRKDAQWSPLMHDFKEGLIRGEDG